jgi:peptide/nickel transport system substrate-binding protein
MTEEKTFELSRRGLLQGAGTAAGAVGLGLIIGGPEGIASVAAQDEATTLVEGFVGDFGLLAPIVDANRQTLLLFDALVAVDPATLLPVPNLASSWTVSDDGLTYVFTLDTTATFHDGEVLDADDVKFTFDLLLNEATASGYFSLFSPRVASVEATDPGTVTITLSAPSPTFLNDLSAYSIGILPQHLLADVKPEELAASEFATTSPVGTGPFKLNEYRTGEALILDPNPDYHRGAPKLGGYVLKILADGTVAYQQLKTGEVDVTPVGADFYEDAQAQENFTPVVIDTFAITFLAFNQDPEKGPAPLKDLEVRKALFHAIDRQLIIDSIYSGLGQVAVGSQPPASWAYSPDEITETFDYDPAVAAQILDAAGWVPGDDGIRAKDGERLAFTALGSDSKEGEGTVLALQEFFAEIGVELTPALEGDTSSDTLLAHDYGVALVSYTFAPDPDQSLAWASDSIYNAWSFSNARVDELLKEGLATSDVEVRKPIYLEVQNIIQAELPAAVLFFPQRVTGVNNRVANYTPTAVGYYWAIAYDAPTWEIAAE